MSDSIKIAVRVRPFNSREKKMGCKCIVKMEQANTTIVDLDGRDRNYTFDYSYWSFDEVGGTPANQVTVFENMGRDILDNAFKGYNCSLIAYGQTGSGKSFSMVGVPGVPELRGIIPRVCEEIFGRISQNNEPSLSYSMMVSMIEIYNEKVRDLFNPKNQPQGGLKVREHPKTGPYVDGIFKAKVDSFQQVQKLMDEGSKVRTIASTKMNATSSRAHTVFTFYFTQSRMVKNKKCDRVSVINLVDLAGSERADKTGASGKRLKEGSAINQSLSALGNCISALSLQAGSKNSKVFIPYRSSTLTWLLKESLGGNSKSYMICAISPADNNYGESKSTLDYAKRAKKIQLKAIVNEDPASRIIKELKAEIERLKLQLQGGGVTTAAVALSNETEENGKEEIEGEGEDDGIGSKEKDVDVVVDEEAQKKLLHELEKAQSIIKEMEKTDSDREEEFKKIEAERISMIKESGVATSLDGFNRTEDPHLINLAEDPLLSEALVYPLDPNFTKKSSFLIGSEPGSDVLLAGIGISVKHATIDVEDPDGKKLMYLVPINASECYINGKQVFGKTIIEHGNRVAFGSSKLFKFIHPQYKDSADSGINDWRDAVEELAKEMAAQYMKKLEEENKKAKLEEQESDVKKSKYKKLFGRGVMEAISKNKEVEESANAKISEEQQEEINFSKQLISLIPLVNEANKISDALQRDIEFETAIKEGVGNNKKQIMVKITDEKYDYHTFWTISDFGERLVRIRDYYHGLVDYMTAEEFQKFVDNYDDQPDEVTKDDPFFDFDGAKQFIGTNKKLRKKYHKIDRVGELDQLKFAVSTLKKEVYQKNEEIKNMATTKDTEYKKILNNKDQEIMWLRQRLEQTQMKVVASASASVSKKTNDLVEAAGSEVIGENGYGDGSGEEEEDESEEYEGESEYEEVEVEEDVFVTDSDSDYEEIEEDDGKGGKIKTKKKKDRKDKENKKNKEKKKKKVKVKKKVKIKKPEKDRKKKSKKRYKKKYTNKVEKTESEILEEKKKALDINKKWRREFKEERRRRRNVSDYETSDSDHARRRAFGDTSSSSSSSDEEAKIRRKQEKKEKKKEKKEKKEIKKEIKKEEKKVKKEIKKETKKEKKETKKADKDKKKANKKTKIEVVKNEKKKDKKDKGIRDKKVKENKKENKKENNNKKKKEEDVGKKLLEEEKKRKKAEEEAKKLRNIITKLEAKVKGKKGVKVKDQKKSAACLIQ